MNNITLIGMPGSGKSTVGVLLAKSLGFQFVDVDLLIQQREGALLQELLDTRGVERVGSMKTRLFGSRIYVDLEIEADKSLMQEQAFGIAKEVHDTIEERFPQVKHCSVQVSPEGSTGLEGKEN